MARTAVAALPLLALAFGGTAHAAAGPTVTHPLTPLRDAYVDSRTPDANYGGSIDLRVQNQADQRISYLTFDLAPLLNRKAKSGTLSITVRHATAGMGLAAFRVADTGWAESTITWNSRPALGDPLGTTTAPADGQALTITFPRGTVPKSGLISIAVTATDAGTSASLRSREAVAGEPELTVVAQAFRPLSPLHTDGQLIRNAAGQEVHLTGFQVTGLAEGHGNAYPATDHCGQAWRIPPTNDLDADRMALDGFNSIRLAISWANLEPAPPTVDPATGVVTHTWDPAYVAALHRIVDAYTGRGLYVVLDMAQSQWSPAFKRFTVSGRDFVCEGMGIPAWLYPGLPDGVQPGAYKCDFFNNASQFRSVPELPQDGMAAAWQFLAGEFAGNPGVVGADLLSEPGWPAPTGAQACADTPTSDDLAAFFHRMTDAIRLTNSRLMVLFEDGTWVNYVTRGFTLTDDPKIENSIYSWHYYPDAPGAPGGQQALAEHVQRAADWNLPFNMGEFNAFNEAMNGTAAHTDEAGWEQDTRDLMAYAKANHVSWWLWQWRVGGGGSLIDPATGLEKPLLLAALQSGR